LTEKTPDDDGQVDVSQYASVDDALLAAATLADRFPDITARAVSEDNPAKLFGLRHMFLMSAVARAKGLHDGIVREIRADDPHTVFPLLRTYVELGGLLNYVAEKPDYVQKLMANPRDDPAGRGRVTFQAVWSVAKRRYPGIKNAYAELSEFGHFGSSGVFASWSFDDSDPRPGTLGHVRHKLGPGWRDPDRDPKLAAAWLVEANDMVLREATRFLEAHVLPLNRQWRDSGQAGWVSSDLILARSRPANSSGVIDGYWPDQGARHPEPSAALNLGLPNFSVVEPMGVAGGWPSVDWGPGR
jgi:hypothetical protein